MTPKGTAPIRSGKTARKPERKAERGRVKPVESLLNLDWQSSDFLQKVSCASFAGAPADSLRFLPGTVVPGDRQW